MKRSAPSLLLKRRRRYTGNFISRLMALWFLLMAGGVTSARADWFFGFGSSEPPLDLNHDDRIRIALVSPRVHPGSLSAANICADLEIILRAVTSKPVRVVLIPVTQNKTIFGWWYNPKTRSERNELLSGSFDYILIAESEDVIRQYPEIFFEGVRALSAAARANKASPQLLMLARPGNSYREHRLTALAELVYRVGDGCGVHVIPAAMGWPEALRHNRMPPETPLRSRANDCLAAQMTYFEISGQEVPNDSFTTDWAIKRTVEDLARSAQDASQRARITKQYFGLFTGGTVRILPHPAHRLSLYTTATQLDDPLRINLQTILSAAFQDYFIRTPDDWYATGFDRNSIALDCFYGDSQQADAFLDPDAYTSSSIPVSSAKTLLAVFPPPATASAEAYLDSLESITLEGYAYAREKHLTFIPYPIAWARLHELKPACTVNAAPGKANDWLTYMLANMIYTSLTGRFQPIPEKNLPHLANADHPYGYHALAARIGYLTMRQLATLNAAANTLVLQTQSSRVAPAAPAFARIRLLSRPSAEVAVNIAMDPPSAVLSLPELHFTPDNFDIEQTIRIQNSTNSTQPALVSLMAAAQSEDSSIDGAYDKRLYLVNVPDDPELTLKFSATRAAPSIGFQPRLSLAERPLDTLALHITQHGHTTATVYFTPDDYADRPFSLYPTAADYAAGSLAVTFQFSRVDQLKIGQPLNMKFAVSAEGQPLPRVTLQNPTPHVNIPGPAFVRAEAQSEGTPPPADLAIFLGSKRLGHTTATRMTASVETAAPPSRLPAGSYSVWSAATFPSGLVLASDPVSFTVTAQH